MLASVLPDAFSPVRERERERERYMEYVHSWTNFSNLAQWVIFTSKRNDGCLGTFLLSSIVYVSFLFLFPDFKIQRPAI